jgi:hypothetical protein
MSNVTPLLVPVDVQAMVLNNTSVNFIRAQMNYGNLANCASPCPAPFQEDQVDFATHLDNHGVYLRWTLPKALRHATQVADGGLEFPWVPNRWLVVRLYRPLAAAPGASPQAAAWVVQSDFLHATAGANYVDPTQGTLSQIQIGQMVELSATAPWQEPVAAPYFLRAVSESNPAFAAYQPFNSNVFSIHDALQSNDIGAGTLSYFVQGWYSDPNADILSGWPASGQDSAFADALAQLGWSASAFPGGTRASLYHGAAFGIGWQPLSAPPASPKDQAKPHIAVGNTSVDAVVAFAQAAFSAPGVTPPAGMTPQQAADFLEAFQYNLLPQLSLPGGEAQLEQRIRSQWFGSVAAGTRWTIADAPSAPGAQPAAPASPAELANQAAWLATLNTAQSQFDQDVRSLMSVQRRLFEVWWKQQNMNALWSPPWDVTPEQFDAALDPTAAGGLVAQARAWLVQLAGLATQIPCASAQVTLEQAIANFAAQKNLPVSRSLKAIAQPRFWSASDPVVTLSGSAHMMTLDAGAALACRWPAQLVTGLAVSTGAGGPTFSVTTAQLAGQQPAVNFDNLPPVSAALFAEFFLLDPANAALAALAAGQSVTSAQLAALAASMAAPAPAAGTAPAILAPFPWAQPWQPLYLDWQVTWYPIPFYNAEGKPNWVFDGSDYDLAASVAQPVQGALTGRCVLTPKPSFEFKARLDQFIADHPGSDATAALQALESMVASVDQWDFLSQALSGLHTQLASWSPEPTLLPPNTPLAGGTQGYAELIGAQAQCPPNPQLATPGRGAPPPSTFEGMRGGQFSFARLSIVDAFGQTLEIVTGSNLTQTSVITGDGLHVSQPVVELNSAGLVQLPPRVLQPARLNFQFTAVGENANPIVGWIVPNHIDGALAAYGADGMLYGELSIASDISGQPVVAWWPAPDTPYATLAALLAAQAQFGGFLAALQHAGAAALGDFLRSIDETLWSVNPLAERSDSFLDVMLGRPLAVVGAVLSLELQTTAWTDTAWPYTFADPLPSPGLLAYQFALQLGDLAARDDGLLGHFADGDYTRFNAVHLAQPGPNDPPLSGYVAQIGAGNWVELGFAASGPGPAQTLTLVMDPRAAVHAQCGILPAKEVTLVANWVDSAFAAMKATFRTGPLLAEVRQLVAPGQASAADALLIPIPAERHGTWQWRQVELDGSWPATALATVDGNAVFPDTTPIVRDGVLQLSGALDD